MTQQVLMNWAKITQRFVTPEGVPFLLALLGVLVLNIFVGLWEEIAFRVYLLPTLAQGWNAGGINSSTAVILALLATSVPFGLAHLGNENATPQAAVFIAAAGMMLGLGFILTGRPALGIGLHIAGNIFQTLFGVTATTATDAQFFKLEVMGPKLWTGGAYGTEAGLLGMVFIVISVVLLLGYVGLRYGSLSIHGELAQVSSHSTRLSTDKR